MGRSMPAFLNSSNLVRHSLADPASATESRNWSVTIFEQLGWNPPDWIIFPVGTGSGIVGCYKGLQELRRLGWINKIPRLVCVQAEGCAPIAGAYKQGEEDILPVKTPKTVAEGLAVGAPPKGKLVLEALRKTGGLAELVNDVEILETAKTLAAREGLFVEVSSAPSVAGAIKLIHAGVIDKNDRVVCELTGTGLKSHAEYAKMTPAPLEIEPNLQSLLKELKIV